MDASLGAIVSKLKSKGLYGDTLIIVASKHGNAPINPALFGEVDPAQITNATGVPVEWQTVLIPLHPYRSLSISLSPPTFSFEFFINEAQDSRAQDLTYRHQLAKKYPQSDDIALIFLNESSTTATAVANLNADRTAGKILNIYADAPGATPLASHGQ